MNCEIEILKKNVADLELQFKSLTEKYIALKSSYDKSKSGTATIENGKITDANLGLINDGVYSIHFRNQI